MAKLLNEEIQKIYVEIESGDLPDFSKKAADAAKELTALSKEAEKNAKMMAALKEQGKESSEEFAALSKHSKELNSEIKKLTKEQAGYTNALDITQMSTKQLAEKQKMLRQAMDNALNAGDMEAWDKLNDEYIKVTKRMSQVRAGTIRVSESMDITKMSVKELKAYSKQLADQMEEIPGAAKSPEWQKLNKRMEDVKKQLGDTGDKSKIFIGTLSTAFGNVATKGLSMLANGIKKVAKDLISHSNKIGDRWAQVTTGMRKSYETFLTAITSGDWSNLFTNMAKAYENGVLLAKLKDELFELENSKIIKETENEIEIAKQTAIMRDTTKSNEERIAAAEKILELEQQIAKNAMTVAEQKKDAAVLELKIKAKINEEDAKWLIDDYFDNRELIEEAQKYMDLQAKLEQNYALKNSETYTLGGKSVREDIDKTINSVQTQITAMRTANGQIGEFAERVKKYNLLNDENVKGYVDAQVEYLNIQQKFEQQSIRPEVMRAKLMDDLRKEEFTKAVAAANKKATAEANVLKQQYLDGKLAKEDFDKELERIDQERLEKVNEINRKYGKDTAESYGAVLDNLISKQQDFYKAANDAMTAATEEANRKFIDSMKQTDEEVLQVIDDMLADIEESIAADMDGFGEDVADAVRKAGEIKTRFADKDTKMTMLSADRDAEMAELQNLYDMKLISEEEFQRAKNDIISRYASEAVKIQTEAWEGGLQTASGFLNNISSLVNSVKDAQSSAIDAQMQEELAAAGDNAEARAEIEEKYEQQKLDLQKKYADIDMGIKIAQTISAGALAAIQAFAQLGPIPGGIMAGIIAATTAAQVATIVMQRNAIKNATAASSGSSNTAVRTLSDTPDNAPGFSEGGFTGYGGRLEPAGIVHRGEYVVPVPEMRDPDAYRHVMAIEEIRSRRTGKNRLPGYAEGGMVSGVSSGTVPDTAITEMISLLRSLRDNPIKAYTVLSEHNAKQELYNSMKKAASRR